MDVIFATVLSCDGTGCNISYVDGPKTPEWADYSAPVRDRIRIRRRQLVAVDRAVQPPQIVWRWYRGEVLELRPTGALVGSHGICAELPLRDPSLILQQGDEVWFGGYGGEMAIHDIVHEDRPADPEALAAEAFPRIEAWYAELRA